MNLQQQSPLYPKVGIGLLILRGNEILLGHRIGSHGADHYAGAGGSLEFGETLEECAERENREETGMKIRNLRFLCVTTLLCWKNEDKHFVDIGFTAEWVDGEPQVLEPSRCRGWDWYSREHPPEPLFPSVTNYLIALKTGRPYFQTIV